VDNEAAHTVIHIRELLMKVADQLQTIERLEFRNVRQSASLGHVMLNLNHAVELLDDLLMRARSDDAE